MLAFQWQRKNVDERCRSMGNGRWKVIKEKRSNCRMLPEKRKLSQCRDECTFNRWEIHVQHFYKVHPARAREFGHVPMVLQSVNDTLYNVQQWVLATAHLAHLSEDCRCWDYKMWKHKMFSTPNANKRFALVDARSVRFTAPSDITV